MRFRWEMRAQISQIEAATALWKNECWRCPRRSTAARSFFLPPTIPSARRRAKSDFLKRPAALRFRRYPRAPGAAPSTSCQTAPWSSHGQTHRAAQTSAECSGCGRMPAPRLVFQDSCRLPWSFTARSRPQFFTIPSTILSSACPAGNSSFALECGPALSYPRNFWHFQKSSLSARSSPQNLRQSLQSLTFLSSTLVS